MSKVYELIGRLVVWFVRQRYETQIKAVGAAGVIAALAGGYLLAKREPPEG
jgi:hypothetical protein